MQEVGAVYGPSVNAYQGYINELEGLLSTNPAMRMEANASTIADINATAQGERAQIANLPRGGESAFLSAQIDQNTATAIGDALSKTYNQALAALGQAGEFGTSLTYGTQLGAGGLQVSTGNAYEGLGELQNEQQQGIEGLISSLASDLPGIFSSLGAGAGAGAAGALSSVGEVFAG
jgi:hypothetical protein